MGVALLGVTGPALRRSRDNSNVDFRAVTGPLQWPRYGLRQLPYLQADTTIKDFYVRRFFVVAVGALLMSACNPGDQRGGGGGVDLTGAGATFPYPLYSRWFSDYARETGVRVNYQSIGSGGGIRQLLENTVDFGATDGPMTDTELQRARGEVMHIPTILGAVVLSYNVPGIEQPLQLSGDVIADIFLGRITRWNDPRIAQMNPGVNLPAQNILVVHRSDGSGTTFVFTDYLASVSPDWANGPGRAKEVQWPVGLGGKGNEGVAGQIRQTPGSIGYIEAAYARQNRLSIASVRNAAGNFVQPTEQNVTASAQQEIPATSDYRVSIVNSPATDAYPISSFTWIILYRQQQNAEKGRKLVDFLHWALTTGQQSAARMDYAPLPDGMRERLRVRIDSIQVGAGA